MFIPAAARRRVVRTTRRSTLSALSVALFLAVMITTEPAHGAVPATDLVCGRLDMQTPAPTGRIVVRLTVDCGLAMGPQGLQTRPQQSAMKQQASDLGLQKLQAKVAAVLPGSALEARFPGRPVASQRVARGSGLPDLTRYAHIDAGTEDPARLKRLLARLREDPAVELAFLEPKSVPAALGFDVYTGDYTPPEKTSDPQPPTTPDFESMQGYLGPAPLGVDARNAWAYAGADGAGVTAVDVEFGWNWGHEDLPAPVIELHSGPYSSTSHGTAAMAEICGIDNGFGVTGITPACAVGGSSCDNSVSVAQAIANAADLLSPGDIIFIELHGAGPIDYMPMEYWQDVFDVIRYATCRGLIVVEAAGNGTQNLDDPMYLGLFDRNVRDSGAILCGATWGSALIAADFTNRGSRVDLNGWGYNVVTAGYGDLYSTTYSDNYTERFSGTSSATPIVTGAVASLQGMVRHMKGFDLDARLARDILRETGSALLGTSLIGTRPRLLEARLYADIYVGQVAGTITDAATGLPIEGVLITQIGAGAFTTSDADGRWRMPLKAGSTGMFFEQYFYEMTVLGTAVTAGATTTLDVQLNPRPTFDLTGTVRHATETLSGVHVTPLIHQVGGTATDLDGGYTLADIPVEATYTLLFDGAPGYGPRLDVVSTSGATEAVVHDTFLPSVDEDFEIDAGGFTTDSSVWTWGVPPAIVTGGAFDGNSCWGVGMENGYVDNLNETLNSPVYDLSDIAAESYTLGFHYYCATEEVYDGVNLEASSGGAWTLLTPLTGYDADDISGLGMTAGWAGDSGRWAGAVFDITAYLGGDFSFRLNFGSDEGVSGNGFYFDSLAFSVPLPTTAVPDRIPRQTVMMDVYPNPFNPRTTIAFDLPQPAAVDMAVYDLDGRVVRTLSSGQEFAAGPQKVDWNGHNDSGRRVAAGVYFIHLKTVDANLTQKVVLVK